MIGEPQRPLRGIALKLGAVVSFIAMSALIKSTAPRVPPGEAVFFRSAFAIPVIFAWLALRGELATSLRAISPFGHLWRGLLGTLSMGLGFAALGYLPLPEVTAISYTTPLLTVIFAAMFLDERVRLFRTATVAMGLVGVLIVLAPRLTLDGGELGHAGAFGAMLVLTSAVFAALAQVFVRKLVQTEATSVIVFWFSVTATVLSLATLPFGWVVPRPGEAAALIAAGLLGGIGQILLTSAYREADASLIAPFDYASMLFAIAIGYAVFGEVPTAQVLVGAGIVIAAGLAIVWRERDLARRRRD
jgi:drug/metabolite transporter (DMT)-like permease